MAEARDGGRILGAELPEGVRFVGTLRAAPGWGAGDAPLDEDLARCVACGLCLPHCPTYRLTGEESASPRGRIAAMRAVAEGRATVDAAFVSFMDACLACRACEDVCPSHVPYGRLIEHARAQAEPQRTGRERLRRRLGLDTVLARPWLTSLVARLQPLGRPFLSGRARALLPHRSREPRLPRTTEPDGTPRGTVALLTGCVQDRWYRSVNRATVRVLTRNGWRVVVPREQTCCGSLHAHHGRLGTARRLARRNLRAFEGADAVVSTSAGCSAHLAEVGALLETDEARVFAERARDVVAFLHDHGIEPPSANPGLEAVAYHDACHALRALHLRDEPRALLAQIPGLRVVDIPDGETCCGAAGLYAVTQPQTADALMRAKAEAIASTGVRVVASANPGCTMQIAAGLRALGAEVEVVHPVELLDRAYAAEARERESASGYDASMRVAERWYEHREVDDGVLLLWEPHVDAMIRGNFWLVRGRERDLLVDGGLGIGPLRAELADLFDKPVLALATHRHFDHIGAMHEFEEVLVHPADADVLREGGPLATLFAADFEESFLREMEEAGYEIHEMLIDAYPYEGFDPGAWSIAPAPPTRLIEEGDVVDLGDRRFEVLHLPGHTPGEVGLWEADTGTFFSGDCVYENPPFLDELPESDIADYVRSMQRLRDLPVRIVHGGHDASFGRARMLEMIDYYLELRGEETSPP